MRSCTVTGEGGPALGEVLKRNAKAIVRVRTDDAEIDIGYLVAGDDQQIRVATVVQKRMFDRFIFGNRQCWQVLSIPRNRIKSVITLN